MKKNQKQKEATEETRYRKGEIVEITSDEDGFRGAWFVAKIIRLCPLLPHSRKRSYLVEYQSLLNDEGSKPLREHASPSFVRPSPPKGVTGAFEVDEVVDALDNDGWWEGVVTRVLEDSRYSVYFASTGEELEFSISDLRPHFEWIKGEWVRSEKRQKELAGISNNLAVTNDPAQISSNPAPTTEIGNQLPMSNSESNNDRILSLGARKKFRKRRKKQIPWPGTLKRKKPKRIHKSKSAYSDKGIDTETLVQSDAQIGTCDLTIGSEEIENLSAEGVDMVRRKRSKLQPKEKEFSVSNDPNETMGKQTCQAGHDALTTVVANQPPRSSPVSNTAQMKLPGYATTSSEKAECPTPNSGDVSSSPVMKGKRKKAALRPQLEDSERSLGTATLISCQAKDDNPTSGLDYRETNDLDEDSDSILRTKRRRRHQKEKDLSVISNDLDRTKGSEKTRQSSSTARATGITIKLRRTNSASGRSPAYDTNSSGQEAHTTSTRNEKNKHCSTKGVNMVKKRGRPRKQKESSLTTNDLGETKDTERTCQAINAASTTDAARLLRSSSGTNTHIGSPAYRSDSREKVENSTPISDPMLSLSSRKRKKRKPGEPYSEGAMDTATATTAMTDSDAKIGSPSSTIKSDENKSLNAEGVVVRKKLGRPPKEKKTTPQKTVVHKPTIERGRTPKTRSGGRLPNKVTEEDTPRKASGGKASSGEGSDAIEAFIKGVLRDIADEYQSTPEINNKDNIFISQLNEVAAREDPSVTLLGDVADGHQSVEATDNMDDTFASRSNEVPTEEGPSHVSGVFSDIAEDQSPSMLSRKDDLFVAESNEIPVTEDPSAITGVLRVSTAEQQSPPVIDNRESVAVSESVDVANTGEPSVREREVQESTNLTKTPDISLEDLAIRDNKCDALEEENNTVSVAVSESIDVATTGEPSVREREVQESTYLTKTPDISLEDLAIRDNQCDALEEETNTVLVSDYQCNDPSVEQIETTLHYTDKNCSEKQNEIEFDPGDDHRNEATDGLGHNAVDLQSLVNDSTNITIPMENENLPFVKRSFMWEKIELMDIFKKIPQKPHFRPLEMYSSTHREGMAIGHMITFANLVAKIYESQFDKPRRNLEDILKTLDDLEALGFNIQKPRARVQKLLKLKETQRMLEDKSKSVEEKLNELRNENAIYDTELVKIDKCVRELEETLAKLTEDLVSTTMRKRNNFSDITSLQKEMDSLKDTISSYKQEFCTLASSCWVD